MISSISHKAQDGIFVLATAIFLLVVISLTAFLSSKSAYFELLSARNEIHNTLARQAAANGLEEVIGRVTARQNAITSYITSSYSNQDSGNNWGFRVNAFDLGNSMFKLVSYGCADGCPSKTYFSGSPTDWENVAVATQILLIKQTRIRDGALICGGSCTTFGGPTMANSSPTPPFTGPAIVAGGSTPASANPLDRHGTETTNDAALATAASSADNFSQYFYGMNAADLKGKASNTGGGCYSGSGCNTNFKYVNTQLNGTYGSESNPVLLIVDASSPTTFVAGSAIVYGAVIVLGNSTSIKPWGSITVHGQLISQSGNFDGSIGSFNYTYRQDLIEKLRDLNFPTTFSVISSSWTDTGV